eukprot:1917107-Pyramimonas_sp.AAC.2
MMSSNSVSNTASSGPSSFSAPKSSRVSSLHGSPGAPRACMRSFASESRFSTLPALPKLGLARALASVRTARFATARDTFSPASFTWRGSGLAN